MRRSYRKYRKNAKTGNEVDFRLFWTKMVFLAKNIHFLAALCIYSIRNLLSKLNQNKKKLESIAPKIISKIVSFST